MNVDHQMCKYCMNGKEYQKIINKLHNKNNQLYKVQTKIGL